jgi:hypothetical protein
MLSGPLALCGLIAPLKKEGQLVADTKQKANILNEQFKSVFTTESIDNIPNKGVSPHPDIPPLTITTFRLIIKTLIWVICWKV